jgi:hypothetical protein
MLTRSPGVTFFLLQFGTLIGLRVKNPIKLSFKWTYVAQDIQVEMDEGQHCQITRFDFEGCDFHALSFLFFLP